MKTPEYTQGIAKNGVAILRNGETLKPEEILCRLQLLNELREIIFRAPELNPINYNHEEVCQLNSDVNEAWGLLSDDDEV